MNGLVNSNTFINRQRCQHTTDSLAQAGESAVEKAVKPRTLATTYSKARPVKPLEQGKVE